MFFKKTDEFAEKIHFTTGSIKAQKK